MKNFISEIEYVNWGHWEYTNPHTHAHLKMYMRDHGQYIQQFLLIFDAGSITKEHERRNKSQVILEILLRFSETTQRKYILLAKTHLIAVTFSFAFYTSDLKSSFFFYYSLYYIINIIEQTSFNSKINLIFGRHHIILLFWGAKLCSTLRTMDCTLPGSSVHGISQARTLEWGATFFSKGFFQLRNPTYISGIVRKILCYWVTRKSHHLINPNPFCII